jgi:drug/metabolite transporter (DMT)-like permease
MLLTDETKAHVLLVITQLCFSGWHIVGSQALSDGADPLIFALYREATALVLMTGTVRIERVPLFVAREDLPRFLFLGACSFVNVVGTILALTYLSATRYSIMQPCIPVLSCLISVALGFEGLTPYKVLGIVLAVGGAVLVDSWSTDESDDDSSGQDIIIGSCIVMLQCLAMACISVFQKPLLLKYASSLVTCVYYGLGAVLTLLLCAGWYSRFDVADLYFRGQWSPWVALAYAATFASFFAYNAIAWAGTRVSPSMITVYFTLQPVGTALLSFIIWSRVITLPEAVGGTIVGLGLVVTIYARRREVRLESLSASSPDSAAAEGVGYLFLEPATDSSATSYSEYADYDSGNIMSPFVKNGSASDSNNLIKLR